MRTGSIAAIAFFLFLPIPAHARDKKNVMIVSWGDVITSEVTGAARLDTPDKVRESVRTWKSQGIDQVLFRGDNFRVLLFHDTVPANEEHRTGMAKTRAAWESDLMATAVDAMKEAGIRAYVWLTVLDEGCPPDVLSADSVPFPWQSRFTRQNPQYLACDRSLTANGRKYHWGFMEYAYPEVRQYMLKVIRAFSDRFDLDGVFLSLRSHSPPPSTPINSASTSRWSGNTSAATDGTSGASPSIWRSGGICEVSSSPPSSRKSKITSRAGDRSWR